MVTTAIKAQQLGRDVQAQLGLMAAMLSSHSFKGIDVRSEKGVDGWARLTADQVVELRQISSRVAVATYQIARWLQTGYTLGDTGIATGEELVQRWLALMLDVAGLPSANGVLSEDIRAALRAGATNGFTALAEHIVSFEKELAAATGAVRFDPWNWDFLAEGQSTRIADLLREQALRKARERLRAETSIDPEKLDEITQGAESRAAGLADAIVMRGGRAIPINTALADTRVVYFARGTSYNPCGFCAMLASRGPVYKGNTSMTYAALTEIVRSYHDNCHCFPIFSFSDDTELPDQNKFFEANWEHVTADYSGREKLNAWRRWLNANKRENGGILKIDLTQGG